MEETGLPLPAARCLSKEQAAAYLGIGVTLLAQLDVPSVHFGRRCVYDRVDLDAWLDDHKGERRRAGKEKQTWPVTKVAFVIFGSMTCGTRGPPGIARRERPAMNSRT